METLALTGSIAVTETVEKLCARFFTFKPLGPTRVKGGLQLRNYNGKPVSAIFQIRKSAGGRIRLP